MGMLLAVAAILVASSSCVLWAETHFRIEQGKHTYVYIHVTPSNQIKDVAVKGCNYEYQCVGSLMRDFIDIGNGFAQGWWNAAWSGHHAQEAALKLRYEIGTNRCLTMVKLSAPQVVAVGGGRVATLTYRWQSRTHMQNGCRTGQVYK